MSECRIVVTGMGVISPLGNKVLDFWAAVCRGESGIRDITRFNTSEFPTSRGGEVRNFTPPAGLKTPTDLANQFMLAAADEAIRAAGLDGSKDFCPDTGVAVATNFGGYGSAGDFFAFMQGRPDARATGFDELSFLSCAGLIARHWQFQGPATALSLSCSSGSSAIAYSADLIRAGRAKIMLAGGYDALSTFAWSGLNALRTMTKDVVRPFDLNRAGTIFSEGAGALVIEELEHARARNAPVLAELTGYGMNNNAFHMTAPSKEGAGTAAVMRMALRDAGLGPDGIDHINAHGTGTKPNDVTETQAIKAVFGEHAAGIPVTSIKSSVGHMMGAAGSVEAIASILSLAHGIIPPTVNFQTADPECDLDYVFNIQREVKLNTVLSNSAGFGGCNTALIFRKYK